MKTRKKLLIALLSATCLTAGAFGLTACKNKNNTQTDTRDPSIVAIYNQYTAYAESQGQDPMSYEEWMLSIKGEQGTPGQQGKPGDPGEPGEPGEPGKSAYEIYVDNLGPDETKLSEEEWLASLVGAVGANGITPHIDPDTGNWFIGETDTGVKAEGVDGQNGVGVSGVSLSADGKMLVVSFTSGDPVMLPLPSYITHQHSYAGDFNILMASEGGEYLAYQVCKSSNCDHIELFTFKMCSGGEGTAADPYVLPFSVETAGKAESFGVIPQKQEKNGYSLNKDVYVTFTAPKNGKYSVKNSINAQVEVVDGGSVGTDGAIYAYADSEVTVCVKSGDTINPQLLVTVGFDGEYAAGQSEGFPLFIEDGKTVTLNASDADKDGYVWLQLTSEKGRYKFTSSNANLELSGMFYIGWSFVPEEKSVELGAVVDNIGVEKYSSFNTVIFKAKLPDGTASATLKAALYYDSGEAMSTAINLAHNTNSSFDDINEEKDYVWYKYVATAGLKTIECPGYDYASFYIYDENGERLESASGKVFPYEFAAGTYYIQAYVRSATYDSEAKVYVYTYNPIKIRDYAAATDVGLSKYASVTVELGTATSTDNRYYKFTSAEGGKYVISGSSYVVYSDSKFSEAITMSGQEIELSANQTVYIDTYKKAVTVTALTSELENKNVTYVLTVKDTMPNALEGVKVTLMLGNTKVVEGTTGENGVVELSAKPGEYEVVLDFGDDAENYGYTTTVTTPKSFDERVNVSVSVNVVKTYTINVLGSRQPQSGVEVSIWTQVAGDRGSEADEPEYEKVGETKTTGANGSVTFDLMSGGNYVIRLEKVPAGFEYREQSISSNQNININLVPATTDDSDDPEVANSYSYVYTGWEAEFEGEKTFKLFTESAYADYTIRVEGGYVKYLKSEYAYWEDTRTGVFVEDGMFTADAEEIGQYMPTVAGSEIYVSSYCWGIVDAKIELVVCAYPGCEAKLVIEKVLESEDY